jgi:hypothetical protein
VDRISRQHHLQWRFWLQSDSIVNGILQALFAPEVSLRGLDGDVTQQKLDLLEFASGLVAQPRASPSSMPHTA